MIKKQATENERARTGTTLFRTKETRDQKTSIMEMCITGYSVMDNAKRRPVIHITGNPATAEYRSFIYSIYQMQRNLFLSLE
ncbi:MAG: hypothetical protein HFF17_14090 [Oscillospiraceae bacterium]|nr:hypothetical protein [Oscillospiraceae bacterium]